MPLEQHPTITPKEQRRKAVRLLRWLRWLIIAVVFIAIAWLYVSQQRFKQEVLGKLQSNEQIITRLNEMDDRFHAMSQQTQPKAQAEIGSQANNQLDMLRIQLQAAQKLIEDNDYTAAATLLRGLHWQLSQPSNEIAPALTLVIKQSLQQDIAALKAKSSQPNLWQMQNLAIVGIQEFLRQQVTVSSTIKSTDQGQPLQSKIDSASLYQISIHEAMMTLNLAMQASNMRDKAMLLTYLQQAKQQLILLPTISKNAPATEPSKKPSAAVLTKPSPNTSKPQNMQQVMTQLDDLMAHAPTPQPLITMQVLSDEQGLDDGQVLSN